MRRRRGPYLFLVLPLASISFLLISDLNSPHAGVIRVLPQDLANLAEPLR